MKEIIDIVLAQIKVLESYCPLNLRVNVQVMSEILNKLLNSLDDNIVDIEIAWSFAQFIRARTPIEIEGNINSGLGNALPELLALRVFASESGYQWEMLASAIVKAVNTNSEDGRIDRQTFQDTVWYARLST